MTTEYDNNNPQSANSNPQTESPTSAINVLRRFVRPRAVAAERCDLCGADLAQEHTHLFEPPTRQLFCSCEACSILFSGQTETKYRRVPRRVRYLADFRLSDAQWESLLIPIGMAFFFHSSPAGKTLALYPSPAGATESLLDLSAWTSVVEENPLLREMEPDVEALLVNRVRGAADYYVAPIDECYKLVGLIRAGWRGLSGGAEVWQGIEGFFAELKTKSGVVGEAARA
jgi:hypothetical protein